MLNLTMRLGDIDLAFSPTGPRGFADLKRCAVPLDAAGVTFLVASLADVIRSGAAAHREKDRRAQPRLRAPLGRTAGEDRAATLDDGARRATGERRRD